MSERSLTGTGVAEAVERLLHTLGRDSGTIPAPPGVPPSAPTASDSNDPRTRLAHLLTVRPPTPLDPEDAALLDALLSYEASGRPRVDPATLPRLRPTGPGARISHWQGDVTTLAADAIVNAANDRMLGCWLPGHACIDNAIHAVAGPALRAECAAHMAAQGHPEPTGAATLTRGYHLPARHVLHTVGPIVADHTPTPAQAAQLASCYTACLDAARTAQLASVAFCSISTGAFGYPIESASEVAIRTVVAVLDAHPDAGVHVIFNTYSDRDTAVYRDALARLLP